MDIDTYTGSTFAIIQGKILLVKSFQIEHERVSQPHSGKYTLTGSVKYIEQNVGKTSIRLVAYTTFPSSTFKTYDPHNLFIFLDDTMYRLKNAQMILTDVYDDTMVMDIASHEQIERKSF